MEEKSSNGTKCPNIEFRVMPSGDGGWYWEIIRAGREVMRRGLADTEPAACKEAGDAARQANLIH